MTYNETIKLLAVIKATYPSFAGNEDTVMVWSKCLEDYPYEQVSAATMAYISTEHFPPVPADIISRIAITQEQDYPTAIELWGVIRRGISNGLYGYVKEYEALPPICKRVVGRPEQLREWAMLGEELDTVIASNVQRSLEGLLKNQKELDKIPQRLQDAMRSNRLGGEGMKFLGGDYGRE